MKYKKKIRRAECHPHSKHHAIGLCAKCYRVRYKNKHKKKIYQQCKTWASNNKKRSKYFRDVLRLKKHYGITIEQYDSMRKLQKYRCLLCNEREKKAKLCIDHCHQTGKIRGLLCRRCNLMLGHAKDKIEVLKTAIKYLQKNK